LVILTVLYLDLRGVLFGNFDCIIFGLERESCLVILTIIFGLEGVVFGNFDYYIWT
jgi:hypothetical protein